jgi:RNA polymerase sigma factor (sigma-70 family)
VEGDRLRAWQHELRSSLHWQAWNSFLNAYSSVILQAVRKTVWDEERAADCFVFVCERLQENHYRRLLSFRPDHQASFPGWLRVVVRRLALDWHRKQVGRQRPFDRISRLPLLHRALYHLRFERRLSLEESYEALRQDSPSLSLESLATAEDEIRRFLTDSQNWKLVAAHGPASLSLDDPEAPIELADGARTPEEVAIDEERLHLLGEAFTKLPPDEQVLLQLRFSRGLTLQKIAAFAGLPDAQSADRRIRACLEKMRKEIGSDPNLPRKNEASVRIGEQKQTASGGKPRE